jgi:hypothetical protein
VVFTGTGVQVYRLTVAKHAILLEEKGIRMSRGRSWTSVMRKELGFKRSAPRSAIVAAIDALLSEMVPKARAEGGITP